MNQHRTSRREWLYAAAAASTTGTVWHTSADDATSLSPESEALLQTLEQEMDLAIPRFTVECGVDAPRPLSPVKLSKWTNFARGQVGFGISFGYVDGGKLAALVDVYPWNEKLNFEFSSLAREPITAALDGGAVWLPDLSSDPFQPWPNGPAPGRTRPQRLQQLKGLARELQVTFLGWKGDGLTREPLRLQPTPLYRYAQPSGDVIDGAVFNFVQDVDPEAMLAIEVVRTKEAERFEFALRRRTSAGLEAALDDESVWSAPVSTTNRDPSRIFCCVGLPRPESTPAP